MTTGQRLVVVAIGMALAALGCGSGVAAVAPAPSAPPDGVVMTATNMAFDRAEVIVPADQPFQLLFENRDGAPHNVTVLGAAGSDPVYVGEVFGGADSRLYEIPALAPGTYRFRCDVHPDMAGTMVAEPSPAAVVIEVGSAAAGQSTEPWPKPAPAPR